MHLKLLERLILLMLFHLQLYQEISILLMKMVKQLNMFSLKNKDGKNLEQLQMLI